MIKKIFTLTAIVFLVILSSSVYGQTNENKLSLLLDKYYGIKNALVAGDVTIAAKQASEFSAAVNAVETKALAETAQSIFKELQPKLDADAKFIAGSKDLGKQRETFAAFSVNMISLAKSAKLTEAPLYIDYCPMKKSYWLSAEQPIKNPYYGSSMLTCGKVTETLK